MLLALAAKLSFKISSTDVKFTYLQSGALKQFMIYTGEPAAGFDPEEDKTPKYTNPLYDLSAQKYLWKFPQNSYKVDLSFFIEKIKITSGNDLRNEFTSKRMILERESKYYGKPTKSITEMEIAKECCCIIWISACC